MYLLASAAQTESLCVKHLNLNLMAQSKSKPESNREFTDANKAWTTIISIIFEFWLGNHTFETSELPLQRLKALIY